MPGKTKGREDSRALSSDCPAALPLLDFAGEPLNNRAAIATAGGQMSRWQYLLLVLLLLSGVVTAADIALKDGSKVTGKIVGMSEKFFEVDSTYGHLQVPRQEIVSITFPENQEKQ